jgi:hypothetical protein
MLTSRMAWAVVNLDIVVPHQAHSIQTSASAVAGPIAADGPQPTMGTLSSGVRIRPAPSLNGTCSLLIDAASGVQCR